MEDDAIEAITTLLMPLASIITPNLSETEVLAGKQIRNIEMMKTASRELLNYGCRAVLVKRRPIWKTETCATYCN
mgnify:CR=1 FL=1